MEPTRFAAFKYFNVTLYQVFSKSLVSPVKFGAVLSCYRVGLFVLNYILSVSSKPKSFLTFNRG